MHCVTGNGVVVSCMGMYVNGSDLDRILFGPDLEIFILSSSNPDPSGSKNQYPNLDSMDSQVYISGPGSITFTHKIKF